MVIVIYYSLFYDTGMLFKDGLHSFVYQGYERLLTNEIKEGLIPTHIAVIMDGNRRFAKRLGFDRIIGHYRGADVCESVIDWCWDIGVKHLTLYAFSTENFRRSESERNNLFDLIASKLDEICTDECTHERQMGVHAIGDIGSLPVNLQDAIARAGDATQGYDGMHLNVALAYGGRRELVDVARLIAEKVRMGMLSPEDVDEEVIARYLYTEDVIACDVDLIIRTGGDMRVSNFLPWQSCGNECAAYFCAPYWPEFRRIDLLRAIRTYQMRESERQRKTVIRVVNLLAACGHVEAIEVIRLSRKILEIPQEEIKRLLMEILRHNRSMAEMIKW